MLQISELVSKEDICCNVLSLLQRKLYVAMFWACFKGRYMLQCSELVAKEDICCNVLSSLQRKIYVAMFWAHCKGSTGLISCSIGLILLTVFSIHGTIRPKYPMKQKQPSSNQCIYHRPPLPKTMENLVQICNHNCYLEIYSCERKILFLLAFLSSSNSAQ